MQVVGSKTVARCWERLAARPWCAEPAGEAGGKSGLGVKASARARGQADSGAGDAGTAGTVCDAMDCESVGGGAKRLVRAVGAPGACDGTALGTIGWRGRRGLWGEQTFHAADQFLRLKGFADQFVGVDGDGFVGDGFVDDAGHEDYRDVAELRMLLDLGADGVAVGVGHDDVGDDGVRGILFELREGRSGVGAGDDVDALAAESDLDDFAHGGGVVDEVDGGSALGLAVGEWRESSSSRSWLLLVGVIRVMDVIFVLRCRQRDPNVGAERARCCR